MGKNNNQIATFADLHSIGYRVPSGKETSKECVTYDDVKFMDEFYNSTSKMQNVYIGATYYNGSQYLELDTSNSDVGDFSGTFATSTQNMSIGSKSFLVGNITAPGDLDSMIVWLPIYIKIQMTQSSSNRYFNMRLRITNGSYTTWTSDWLDVFLSYGSSVFESGSTYLKFGIDTSSMYSGNVYQVYIDCEHNEYTGARVAFELRNDYTITAYSSTKCVPYKALRKDTSITIPLTLKESLADDPNFEKVGLRYRYKLNGSWSTKTLWETNPPNYSVSKSYDPDIALIPVDNSNITADYLEVYCTGLARKRKNIWTLEKTDGTTITKTFSNVTGSTYSQTTNAEAVKGGYATFLRDLKSITFKVDND